MIKTVIAYDHCDEFLGDYFRETYFFVMDFLTDKSDVNVFSINGENCNMGYINEQVAEYSNESFVFVGFSHGHEDGTALCSNSMDYINFDNATLFQNSFFYSTACSIGAQLGEHLVENGCPCFMGYVDRSYAPQNVALNDLFIECETYGLRKFMETDIPVNLIYTNMLAYMDEKVTHLAEIDEIVDAMYLLHNRDNLVIIENNDHPGLARTHFHI